MNFWQNPVHRATFALYKDLGRRLTKLHEDHESERAYTSIVEVLASDGESHTMLAEIRESQNRWSEAIDQWQDVVRLRALEPTGLLPSPRPKSTRSSGRRRGNRAATPCEAVALAVQQHRLANPAAFAADSRGQREAIRACKRIICRMDLRVRPIFADGLGGPSVGRGTNKNGPLTSSGDRAP